MRFLLIFLFSPFAFAESKIENNTCKEISGAWYSDSSMNNRSGEIVRHLSKITRKKDGSLLIKGVGLNQNTEEAIPWEISGSWTCKNHLLQQKSDFGTVSFKIKSFSPKKLILLKEDSNSEIVEQRLLELPNKVVSKHLESK